MIAYGTTALKSLGSGKTRFIWSAEGSALPQEYLEVLQKDLNGRLDGLIVAMVKHGLISSIVRDHGIDKSANMARPDSGQRSVHH
jgi:hypothetical protein